MHEFSMRLHTTILLSYEVQNSEEKEKKETFKQIHENIRTENSKLFETVRYSIYLFLVSFSFSCSYIVVKTFARKTEKKSERECVQISLTVNDRPSPKRIWGSRFNIFAWPVDTIESLLKLHICKCFIQKSKTLDVFVARGLYINVLRATSKFNLGKYLLKTQWHIYNNAEHPNCTQ